jgi:hypothetical protein
VTIFDVPTVRHKRWPQNPGPQETNVGSWSNKHYVGADGCREEKGRVEELAYRPASSAIGIFLSREKNKM